MILPQVVDYAIYFFGCEKNEVLLERELNDDQFYWEKRNMFFDVFFGFCDLLLDNGREL